MAKKSTKKRDESAELLFAYSTYYFFTFSLSPLSCPKVYVLETKLHYLVIPGKRNLITEYGPMIGHLKSFQARK